MDSQTPRSFLMTAGCAVVAPSPTFVLGIFYARVLRI